MEQKFLKCEKCGNIVAAVYESGVPIMCCGQKMQQIIPGSVEASVEKHIPVYEVKDNKVFVTVGSVIHPMEPNHYISWIYLETEDGGQRKNCKDVPAAEFKLANDKLKAVYAYCNLHGLWKYEVK